MSGHVSKIEDMLKHDFYRRTICIIEERGPIVSPLDKMSKKKKKWKMPIIRNPGKQSKFYQCLGGGPPTIDSKGNISSDPSTIL